MNRQELSGGIPSTYEPPTLVVHGSIADLTKAMVVGARTDRAFPAGTLLGSITFS